MAMNPTLAEPQAGAHLLRLPEDLLLHVALDEQLSTRNLAAAACSCLRLSELLRQENSPVWRSVCQRWLDVEVEPRAGRAPVVPVDAVLMCLRLKGYRSMARGLVKLRHSPMGLWWMEASNNSPLWDVTKGLLEVAITDQSSGSSVPHYCITGCSKEWFEATEGLYTLRNKQLFSVHVCPERPPSPSSPSAAARAAPDKARLPDQPTATALGLESGGRAAGEAPASSGSDAKRTCSSSSLPPGNALRHGCVWSSSADLSGEEEPPPDEFGMVVPSIELMHDCLTLFRDEFQLRMPVLAATTGSNHSALPLFNTTAHVMADAAFQDLGALGGAADASGVGSSSAHAAAPTAPPDPHGAHGVPRTWSLAEDLLGALALSGAVGAGGNGGAQAASRRWGSAGALPAALASSPSLGVASGGSRRVSQGPEFSAALKFEAQGRCMVLQVTVEWLASPEEQACQQGRLPRRTVSSMAASGVRHTFDALAALCVGSPRTAAAAASSPGRPRRCRKTYTMRFHRVADLPGKAVPPAPLPPAPSGSACPADVWSQLHLLQGLWTAEYGSHGAEVIQVCIRPGSTGGARAPGGGSMDAVAAPLVAGQVPRIEGFKLVGDVNVPAGKLTFVADATRCRAGRFDNRDASTGHEDHRPVLSFWDAGMGIVDMARRPVACRFAGLGQINEVPGIWAPQWEVAELIVYDVAPGVLDDKVLSVLWRDRGSLHLQLMDFMRFPVERREGWARPGPGEGGNTTFMTHVYHQQ